MRFLIEERSIYRVRFIFIIVNLGIEDGETNNDAD